MINKESLKKIKKIKRPIVFIPMAADIIHYGHVRLLKKSSKYGNIVVGLMTDIGLETYKKKPYFNYQKRKELLASIKYIKLIIPLNGLVYTEMSEIIEPDFFIHGSDWNKGPQYFQKKLLQKNMKKWSGKVITLKYTSGISSSIIKEDLKNLIKK